MRILWIEDYDVIVQRKSSLFGEVLQNHQLTHFSDFSQAYRSISDELRQYDLIVLDINLEHSSDVNMIEFASQFNLSNQAFLEEAGFHLYLRLLEQGFPKNRVVFLTGNMDVSNIRVELVKQFKAALESPQEEDYEQAIEDIMQLAGEDRDAFELALETGQKQTVFAWLAQWSQEGGSVLDGDGEKVKNTYNDFTKLFNDARQFPPVAIDKKQDCAFNLQNWLWSHCERNTDNQADFDYLTLRRGILDVVAEIQKDSRIHLTQDFQEWDKITFLDGLAWQLRDFALPKAQYGAVYLALCDYLTKPFDFHGRNLLNEETTARHFKLPLSNLRNWIAHGLIMGSHTQLTAQAAGVSFLFAMESLFDLEKYSIGCYGTYDELKRLYPDKSVLKQQLIDQIKVLSRNHKYYGLRRQKAPLEFIHRLTQKENANWQDENYLRHFYATYLFSLKPTEKDELLQTPFDGIVFHQLQKYL